MATGIKLLRKVQMGLEATKGTAVPATALWRGLGTIEDARELKFTEENVGYLSNTDRSYIGKLLAKIGLDGVATFEQLPYILSAGIEDVVTGAVDGVGTDKLYAYDLPTTTKNTIKAYTLEGGDNQEVEEMEYCFVEEFSLSGKPGEALEVKSSWLGRQAVVSSFTGAIGLPTVEDILFSKGKLYIDVAGAGTVGTTLKSGTFLGMDLKIKTGWVPLWTADGDLYFTMHDCIGPEITLDITFEHDGTATAEKVAWRAQTGRLIRIEFKGSAVATPGTTHSNKLLRIDLAGKWEKFEKLDEQDGNDIVTGKFVPRYSEAESMFGQILVVNELSSLT